MQDTFHQQLFSACEQISPYLAGHINQPDERMLRYNHCNEAFFAQLYSSLKTAHPEAGNGYWLTRCWDLATWQPLYIAFISVYGFRTLPDFHEFGQSQMGTFVAGFCFASSSHRHGEITELVPHAAEQLSQLFESYRVQLDEQYRCRPGFVKHLLADAIINCCLKLKAFDPSLSLDDVRNNAAMWLSAFQLPLDQIANIRESNNQEDNGMISYVRKSCCLVYKTTQGTLCEDCPRLKN
ncbi:conserved hypothetical protein [Vibrio nigripulchritudo SO65]|uniref:siderophore ferric iron reductase n=1 Tax=Vibrio nigripulchritudo TaxID=28173 RepID=UPI0003B187F6|nr:siderophore ferric iron reductase [Vibrio nigripulchritudo]CCN32996.1 conserved hypothetical protein [Vibrio nigripulchritudo AM115]CCN42806.1 conserved hypothetical protein [Vibrio nigripulchritudo FTn2]CCN63601.1 conserved hypothetical protein [Vibrio nigripulchritudo POn4]CCN74009.1 conserved hypothetical protein [Vibrio nigripulchritudo SO65]